MFRNLTPSRAATKRVIMSEMKLGRYQLMDRLGAGGMAEVWLADQTGPRGFRRRCVVKRIHNHLNAQEDFVARFEDEARLAAMLRHPNIVRVEDFGEEDGTLFMALEYIEGWEFADLLRRGSKSGKKIPDVLALDVIIQIAEALDYAHALRDQSGQRLRIVHRDVSPQNILIERGTGAAKLLDFGIASAESNLHETQAGLIKGKIAYFSPEQARGDALDGRTDLYALGLVLYEALAGKRVFRGDSMVQLLREVTEANVPPLLSKRADLPREVLVAVDKATAEDRDARFASGASMAAALRHALQVMGGSHGRSAMDDWVGTLPANSALPKTGVTSAVSLVQNDQHRTQGESVIEATIASIPDQPETILADPQGFGGLAPQSIDLSNKVAVDDEPTVVGEVDRMRGLDTLEVSQGPAARETQPVVTKRAKPFSRLWLVSLGTGIFAVLVVLVLLRSASMSNNTLEPQMSESSNIPPVASEVMTDAGPRIIDVGEKLETQKTTQSTSKEVIKKQVPRRAKPEPSQATKPIVLPAKKPREKAAASAVKQPALPLLEQRDLDAVTMRNFQALANCRQGESGIEISLQIHRTGMPFSVGVAGASEEVSSCLRKLVRKWRYPAHGGSAVRHKIKL